MNKAEMERMLEEKAAQARGDRKPFKVRNINNVRLALNTIFIILGLVGVVLYFSFGDNHLPGLLVTGTALVVKIIEFIVRFLG